MSSPVTRLNRPLTPLKVPVAPLNRPVPSTIVWVTSKVTNADLQAEIEAKCLNGNFYSELPITMESTQRPREMRGKLGGGGVPIHLRTVNGGIRLIVLRSSV